MRQLKVVAAAGSAALLTTFAAAAVPAATAASVLPLAAQAPESAFTTTDAAGAPAACTRPAPDNRVSSTIHCYTPDQIRAHYGLAPLTAQTSDGEGQTIVLVDSYGSPTAESDVNFFAQTFGGPTPDFEAVFPLGHPDYGDPQGPNGGNGNGTGLGTSGPLAAASWAGEANLDVQWAYAIAPKAHIVLLATPPAETQGVQGLPNLMKAIDWAIAKYPEGTVFSLSFGTSEEAFGSPAAARSAFNRFDQAFQRGQARHDTFFASAGDDGSLGVGRAHHQTQDVGHASTSYPNSSPYVTSVGGTQLQDGWTWAPTSDVPYVYPGGKRTPNPAYWAWTPGGSSEAVWNETWGPIGTGGGVSSVYGRPHFQDGLVDVVGEHRGVPDLAWNAAVNGGVLVYRTYFPALVGKPASWSVTGGTSASSPQVAAMTAIANQGRTALHKDGIGDLNSVIYSPTFDKASAFNDIVPQTYGTAGSGVLDDNQMWEYAADGSVHPGSVPGYMTTSGYDLTTGWGTPKAAGYISQLVAH